MTCIEAQRHQGRFAGQLVRIARQIQTGRKFV